MYVGLDVCKENGIYNCLKTCLGGGKFTPPYQVSIEVLPLLGIGLINTATLPSIHTTT